MKKYILSLMACLAMLFVGCQSEELTFEHELQQFETLENAILLELIVPTGTAVDEEIYIYGAFNGLDENTVIGNVKWQLEKAAASDSKWGIYLFPTEFAEGKTLLDGFSFVSKKSGAERDIKGNAVNHTLQAEVGKAYNVWADRWAAYFNTGDNVITHNGPVVYVWDESGFANLNLYMWGDVNDLNGGWPGMSVTGKETINDIEYCYFDMGEESVGLTETLIFSDGGANQLADFGPVTFSTEEPIFLHITADGVVEEMAVGATMAHDGAVVYVLDGMEWGMATTLYMWGEVNNLNGDWPGMAVTGTEKIGDYTYMYFDLGAANAGLNENLIFSNNGASQLADYAYTLGTTGDKIYLYMTKDGMQLISDPENPGDVTWFDPQAKPKQEAIIDIYIYNACDTLAPLNLYAWGSKEIFGGWPGKEVATMDSTAMLNLPLVHTQVTGFVGDAYHLIFNNNAGAQIPDYDITIADSISTFYIKVTDSIATPLSLAAQISKK